MNPAGVIYAEDFLDINLVAKIRLYFFIGSYSHRSIVNIAVLPNGGKSIRGTNVNSRHVLVNDYAGSHRRSIANYKVASNHVRVPIGR